MKVVDKTLFEQKGKKNGFSHVIFETKLAHTALEFRHLEE